jgi:hypothetical protein
VNCRRGNPTRDKRKNITKTNMSKDPISRRDQVVSFGGDSYVQYLSNRVSAGPFLPSSRLSVESYLRVSSVLGINDHFVGGKKTFRPGLVAARFHGDSMIGDDIYHGDIGIFQQWHFEYIDSGKIVLIEKVGEEEGTGALAVKRIVIRHGRSRTPSDVSHNIDWDSPIIEVISSNPLIKPSQLDPSRQYRVRGYLLRVVRPESVELIDSEDLMSAIEQSQAAIPLKRTPRRPKRGRPKAAWELYE